MNILWKYVPQEPTGFEYKKKLKFEFCYCDEYQDYSLVGHLAV